MLSVLDNRWQRTKFKICISIKCCLIMTESWNSLKKPHRTVQRSVPKYVWKRTPGYCIDYSEEENNDVCKSEIYQEKCTYILKRIDWTLKHWSPSVWIDSTNTANRFQTRQAISPGKKNQHKWWTLWMAIQGEKKNQLWFQEIGKDI